MTCKSPITCTRKSTVGETRMCTLDRIPKLPYVGTTPRVVLVPPCAPNFLSPNSTRTSSSIIIVRVSPSLSYRLYSLVCDPVGAGRGDAENDSRKVNCRILRRAAWYRNKPFYNRITDPHALNPIRNIPGRTWLIKGPCAAFPVRRVLELIVEIVGRKASQGES